MCIKIYHGSFQLKGFQLKKKFKDAVVSGFERNQAFTTRRQLLKPGGGRSGFWKKYYPEERRVEIFFKTRRAWPCVGMAGGLYLGRSGLNGGFLWDGVLL